MTRSRRNPFTGVGLRVFASIITSTLWAMSATLYIRTPDALKQAVQDYASERGLTLKWRGREPG